MVTLHPQYVIDENHQRKAVILPLDERERIVEELEELDDIRAYDEAKSGSQDAVPPRHGPSAETSGLSIVSHTPLEVWQAS